MPDQFFNNDLILMLVALWTLPWKGVALWKAAGKKEKIWFVVLMIVNTLGLLEIVYIFFGERLNRLFKRAGLSSGKKDEGAPAPKEPSPKK